MRNATAGDAELAVTAAKDAAPAWRAMSFDDRAAVLLKAAELLSGPWRQRLNAATMLGQSKTAYQAEIDAACELIDFWRFNVHFARQILEEQPPLNASGIWNRTDHRPLEGFVYAITPFNFTAIAGNLPTAPALMGNTVVWKPSPTQQVAAQLTMELLEEAGMPPGVINMVTGDGLDVSEVALGRPRPRRHPLHRLDARRSSTCGSRSAHNLANYATYPRLVGETGGKDFIVAHPSADPDVLRTAMIRGAFEFQGQKCSAASRAYVPAQRVETDQGRPCVDHRGAAAGRRHRLLQLHGRRHRRPGLRQAQGGDRPRARDRERRGPRRRHVRRLRGLLRAPDRPRDRRPRPTSRSARSTSARSCRCTSTTTRTTTRCSTQMESVAPYALTGSIIAQDRAVIADASERLRFAAGNFYINDKPTGAVVGQQPFGGGRASGTNDKAGAAQNLLRWTSAALDQGDVRAAEEPPLPAHGLTTGA